MARNRSEREDPYADRRKKVFWWGVGIVVFLILWGTFALRNEYLALQASGNQHAADRLVRNLLIVLLIIGIVVLLFAWWWASRFIRRMTARLNLEFEESIAHLPQEEQQAARRKRAAIQAALSLGAYALVHEMFQASNRRAQENLRHTQERNAHINEVLEAGRERHTSWDDPV